MNKTTPTGGRMTTKKPLLELFVAWQQAEQRAQLAAQDARDRQVRFKAVAAYLYGPDFAFGFKDGKLTVTSSKAEPSGEAPAIDMTKLPTEPTIRRPGKRRSGHGR